jgi:L-lactate dehydrogenase complex protein LldG
VNTRERLLASLREQVLPAVPLPSLDGPWCRYPDALEQFTLALQQAAGSVVKLGAPAELAGAVAALDVVRAARRVCSLVPGVTGTPLANGEVLQPAELEVVIVAGQFGVAENGAVWVPEPEGVPRSALFLAEHVICTLARSEIVHTLHDAYARLGTELGRYGCFMAGPSKTADIEQALVIGAHGARSLTVVLC